MDTEARVQQYKETNLNGYELAPSSRVMFRILCIVSSSSLDIVDLRSVIISTNNFQLKVIEANKAPNINNTSPHIFNYISLLEAKLQEDSSSSLTSSEGVRS